MVSTRLKNKFHVPTGTKIDLTSDNPKATTTKPKATKPSTKTAKKKLPMEPANTSADQNPTVTIGSSVPKSPPIDTNLMMSDDNPYLLEEMAKQMEEETQSKALVEFQQLSTGSDKEAEGGGEKEEGDDGEDEGAEMEEEDIDAAVDEAEEQAKAEEAKAELEPAAGKSGSLCLLKKRAATPTAGRAKKYKATASDAGFTQPSKEGRTESIPVTVSMMSGNEEGEDDEEDEEDNQSTPASGGRIKGKKKGITVIRSRGLREWKVTAPRVLDFTLYEDLGVGQEVRELFAGIG